MKAKYTVIHSKLRGGMTRREGEIEISPHANLTTMRAVLDDIFYLEQNEITDRPAPSASTGDIIQVQGRSFLIDSVGFTEMTEDEVKAHLAKDYNQIMADMLKIDQAQDKEDEVHPWVSEDARGAHARQVRK